MSSRIQPYRQHPRYVVSTIPSLNENISFDNAPITQSDIPVTPPSSKSKIPLWPTILWIGLGIFLLIVLAIVIVVPIVALANKGTTTTTTTTISTICPTTAITTTVTSSPLPSQCSTYTNITDDSTRSPDYSASIACDTSEFGSTPIWIRFVGSGGTLLANCPIDPGLCGTTAPGWYSGIHPSRAGDITSGYVCFNYNDDYCYWVNLILVTNCNGFYIYYLREPPDCDLRYCTI